MQSRSPGNSRGTDVSHWQGDIDWNLVKRDGISFAFIKATEGVDYQDPRFSRNVKKAGEAGIHVGVYHFCTPSTIEDALKEAGHFINVINNNGGFNLLDLPPVIDIEKNGGLGKKEISQIVGAWIDKVQPAAGVQPIIYSYSHFIREYLDEGLGSVPLWLAHYDSEPPSTCSGWKHWLFLQYTDRGRVRGINGNVDLNEFSGDNRGLAAFSRKMSI